MKRVLIGILCAILSACGQPSHKMAMQTQSLNTYDVTPSSAEAAGASAPQIAYSYSRSYSLDSGAIAEVQRRQVALCTALGPARCQVTRTSVGDAGADRSADNAAGEAKLLVDARIAIGFAERLDAVALAAGGRVSARQTTAEDVTKQIVDVDARLRAKQALADRLLGLIHSANGKVGDLVEAEKAFATTQEELDAARRMQATLRQRVTMSEIDIDYSSRGADGIFAPVRRSVGGAGESLGTSVAALVTFVVVVLPWLVLLAIVLWLMRRLGWRWPFRRRAKAPVIQSSIDTSDRFG